MFHMKNSLDDFLFDSPSYAGLKQENIKRVNETTTSFIGKALTYYMRSDLYEIERYPS